ncbi:hypothetical protein P5673_026406, partial [Acropora cervicornis]
SIQDQRIRSLTERNPYKKGNLVQSLQLTSWLASPKLPCSPVTGPSHKHPSTIQLLRETSVSNPPSGRWRESLQRQRTVSLLHIWHR